jgi:hypothetical protein
VHADDLMLFRQRPHPTDPDKMFYDIWTFELVPDGEGAPGERPRHQHFRHGDKSIGLVLDQDAGEPAGRAGRHAFGGVRGPVARSRNCGSGTSTRSSTISSMAPCESPARSEHP